MDYEVTKIPIIEITDTNGNIITIPSNSNDMNIVDSSLSLKKSIVDSELSFGNAISSEFSCQIFNITEDIKGNMIRLYLEDVNTHNRTTMFTGYIDKSTTDYVGDYRQIVAYDWLYYHRDDDVTDLWRSWTYSSDPSDVEKGDTLFNLKNELEEFIDFQIDQAHGVNNNQQIVFTLTHKEENVQSITLSQLLKMICEIQGTFPYVDETGTKINFATLSNTSIDLSDKYEKMSSTREEYLTKAVDGITVYSSSDAKLLSTLSTATNPYLISGNLLLNYTAKNLGKPTVRTYMRNVYNNTLNGYTQYLPFSLKMIMSDFSIFLGQRVYVSDTIYGYAMSIEYSGPCLIEQTISSIANSENLSKVPAKINDTIAHGSIIAENQENGEKALNDAVNDINDTITNVVNDVDANYTKKADAIKSDTLMYLATAYTGTVTRENDPRWGNWSSTPQKVTATKKYLWTYHIYTMANNSVTYSEPTMTGVYGDTGPQGLSGSGKVYSIKSSYQWIADSIKINNKTVFKSDSNYHKGNGEARCLVEFSGYETFTIMCRSNGENNYDFLVVSTLNAPTVTKTTNVYKSFRGQASATEYTAVTYTDLNPDADYFIRLAYIKDGSVDSGEDRAFFYIPEGVGLEEGIGISETIPVYYVSDSSSYPNKPTSPVGNTSAYNTWSTVMKDLDDTHGWIYTCDQIKFTDGTYKWSDVVIDQGSRYSYVQVEDLKDRYVIKVDNNGNIVTCELGANPSEGSFVNINADTISFVANKTLDIKTAHLGIVADGFTIAGGGATNPGELTIDADYLKFVANKTIDLQTGKIGINSENFKINAVTGLVDITGSLTCRDGQIAISKNNEEYAMKVATHEGSSAVATKTYSQSGGVVNEYDTIVSGEFFEFFNPTSTYGQVSLLTKYLYVTSGMTAGRINTPYVGAGEAGIQTIYTNDLNVSNKISAANIGNLIIKNSNWTTTDISNNTLTKLGYITLNKGIWVLSGKIQLTDNLATNSVLQIGIGTDTTGLGVLSNSVVSATGNIAYKNIGTSNILQITSNNTKVYLYTRQNSGSTVSINVAEQGTWLRAVQIA